ncbi:hypothetical protein C882_3837 [Caenispirillum salinarum AK4]|uniref:Uncharacterized protein n=1 Tax=Caenispirillum salinarum AK4 TaxID=1238182 RepID=K9H327_9PROT|nr:hypothetical protein [Caenispirillum salinarum]EKV31464.1 hypothetical protein C882_3837 [Caenispirillum salinarum AK4]
MRLMPAFTRLGLAVLVAAAAPAAVALAGAMPPEYADPPPARSAETAAPMPAPEPAVSRPLGTPAALVPAPATPEAAPPLPPSALTVTYAEDVGFFSRRGYEDVKEDAALYCAQYGRVAALDSRFEVSDEWYVRFDCVTPR